MKKLFAVVVVFLFTIYYNFESEAAPTDANASTISGQNSTGEGLTIILPKIACPEGSVLIGSKEELKCYKIVDTGGDFD